MTTDHRREAEIHRALAGQVIGHEGTMEHLGLAQFHALLAIHDTLTAADRYAANEAKQRDDEPETPEAAEWLSLFEDDPLDEEEPCKLCAAEAKQREESEPDTPSGRAFTARDKDATDAVQAKINALGEWLAVMEKALTPEYEPAPEPDPLDEDDHRDRVDANGQRWGRMDGGCWHHEGKYPHAFGRCSLTLQQLQGSYGPLTFAPEAAQDATGDDLSASEGESGAEELGEAEDAQEALLCPECGHDLEDHYEYCCGCTRSPAGVVYALIADAVKAERARMTAQLRLTTSSAQDSGDLAELDALADEWEAGTDG